MDGTVLCVAALPDGVHFVVGTYDELRLYHVDGQLVHAFKEGLHEEGVGSDA